MRRISDVRHAAAIAAAAALVGLAAAPLITTSASAATATARCSQHDWSDCDEKRGKEKELKELNWQILDMTRYLILHTFK
ncbi:hypothetical protein ACFSKW_39660 [Nonomuraea mangrovi]|uniref:Secreted protein n=1 Tax=Nonomuraea mangrovi TaxID=2316207 RepID=A0ABW4T889_9ACTN